MPRKLLTAAVAVLLMAPLMLPAAASAQTSGAYVDGAEPWTESDCAGGIPVVVGADAKAQSDSYSAVTLAGVLDTDCVILAGPRDGDMTAAQRARLEDAAEGGYVVGGTAAVPEAKIAGRDMTRLGGATRWATAQQVGSEAAALAAGTEPEPAAAPDTTLTAPADVSAPGLFLDGAEPWIASDCTGDTPIVVGGDAKAQSDIYSAVTLAGVVGTDCVILAGPRDGAMPASQQTRLDAAESGGYVLGGIAAVPAAKIARRDMTRLGGVTRWATAELVGRRASGDTTAGTRTATETDNTDTEPAGFTAVSGGGDNGCALRVDGSIACWYPVWDGVTRYDPPVSGKFTALWGDGWDGCGLRTDGNLSCWNAERALVANDDRPVSGKFTALSVRGVSIRSRGCGVLTDGNLSCWLLGSTGMLGSDDDRTVSAVSGKFTAVGGNGSSGCGLRTDGSFACWDTGPDDDLFSVDRPVSGKFTAMSGRHFITGCGLRTDGSFACWHNGEAAAPPV
ncbi:hypothetical protein [Candidatus Poriferisodalis sp.]|uniref:hypothetical protein n=1 Tax=Candidatus Poriferisodalis sp. TaxID=3101277 RepID=UPI003D0A6A7F